MKIARNTRSRFILRLGYVTYVLGWLVSLLIGSVLFYVIPWLIDPASRPVSGALGWCAFLGVVAVYGWLSRVTGLRSTDRVRRRLDGHFYPPGEGARVRRHWRGVVGRGVICGALGAIALGIAMPVATWWFAKAPAEDTSELRSTLVFFAPYATVIGLICGLLGSWMGAYHYVVTDDGRK